MWSMLLLLGGMAAIAALAHHRNRVRIVVTPIAQADEATIVRVRGKVACERPLRSPFSEQACVYFKVELTSVQFNRKIQYEHSDRCDFAVVDATGTANVSVGRAQLEAFPGQGESTRASRLSERGRALVEKMGWRLPEIAGVVIRESIIAIGDEVDVVGVAVREAYKVEAGERGFRDDPPKQLAFASDVYIRKR